MRQLLVRFLEDRARRATTAMGGVSVHPTAKLKWRNVRYQPGGELIVGAGSMIEGSLVAERPGASILIGKNTFIGNSQLAAAERIEVGDDVLISWGCNIVDHNSHALVWEHRKNDVREWYHDRKDWTHVPIKPVKIGNKCWIGLNVILLKGVELGEGAMIGAGSVVTKSVPPWTIAAGNPARVIREIPVEERA